MPGINVWVAKEVATDPVCASELASVRDLDHPITIGSYSPGAQRQAVRGVAGRLVGHSDAANPAALPLDLIDLTLAVRAPAFCKSVGS